MTVFHAFVLGLIQGVTEFLPVSSSGHLVLAQHFFGINEAALSFNIFIHLATLLAIVLFFGKSLLKVTFKEWLIIGVGTIPAVVVGLLFKDQIEALFANDSWLGVELIITGLINLYTDYRLQKMSGANGSEVVDQQASITLKNVSPLKSFLIGIAQAVAIIPGISRSGSTVAGAISLNVDRETAFRFSFLLAIPALLGAGILEFKDLVSAGPLSIDPLTYGVGAVAALISGLASLVLFKYVMTRARLEWFGWYCIGLGVIVQLFFR